MATYAPYHVDIALWMDWKSSSTYTITRINNSTHLGMGRLNCDAASATGKHIEWDVALAAGTWTLTLIYCLDNNAGVLTPSIDGTDLSTIGMYSASFTPNTVAQWTGITIGSAGIKEIKMRTDSKHASSGDYDIYPQWITLTRTGA